MSALAAAVVCGVNDHPHFVSGWYDREHDGRSGIIYRAGGPHAVLRLSRARGAKRAWVLLSGSRGIARRALRGTLSLGPGEAPLELDVDAWTLRSIDLPPGGEIIELALDMEDAPSPNEVLGNGDARRLGWFVSAAWQE